MYAAIQQELWTSRYVITVETDRGTIGLTGAVADPLERAALLAMARALPGCAGVENRLAALTRSQRRQPAPVI